MRRSIGVLPRRSPTRCPSPASRTLLARGALPISEAHMPAWSRKSPYLQELGVAAERWSCCRYSSSTQCRAHVFGLLDIFAVAAEPLRHDVVARVAEIAAGLVALGVGGP